MHYRVHTSSTPARPQAHFPALMIRFSTPERESSVESGSWAPFGSLSLPLFLFFVLFVGARPGEVLGGTTHHNRLSRNPFWSLVLLRTGHDTGEKAKVMGGFSPASRLLPASFPAKFFFSVEISQGKYTAKPVLCTRAGYNGGTVERSRTKRERSVEPNQAGVAGYQ